MDHAYIRLWPTGPTRDAQWQRILPHGVDEGRLHVDDQRPTRRKKLHTGQPGVTVREQAVNVLRPGDHLLVACPAVVGNSFEDVMKILSWIEKQGAVLFDAEFEREIRGIGNSMDYAKHAERQLAHMRTDPMRRALKASGTKPGPKKGPLKVPLKDLIDMWQQPDVFTVDYIAEQAGLKRRATYMLFKGMPRRKPSSEAASPVASMRVTLQTTEAELDAFLWGNDEPA